MQRLLKYLLAGSVFFILYGCIKNDIPYPRIQASFTSFNVQYQKGAPVIDSLNRIITVNLTEEADIENVKILGYKLTQGSHIVGIDTLTDLDLSHPIHITLALYQDYSWTINAIQDISRYLAVQGQIGSSVIDIPGQRVVFTFPENLDVKNVYVDSIKLGQTVSVMNPDLTGKYVDFSNGVAVDVTTFGQTVRWHIYADISAVTVFTTAADAWTNVAWIYGEAEEGKDNGFEYRRSDNSEWTKVPKEWITFNGGSMTARIIHLDPETEYVARAYSNDEYGVPLTFTTQAAVQLPNSTLSNWSLNGKVWQPWGEGQEPYWDTGNKGATVLGTANVMPTDDTSSGTGQAALLKTEFKGIGSIGKLAAGSIYTGTFVRVDGTNGILSMGRTFTQRPTKLTGYYKYQSAPISDAIEGFKDLLGRPDSCSIWVALIDSQEPFEIRTNPNNRHLFDPDGAEVIAYGTMQSSEDVTSYRKFEVEFKYKSTSRIPNYIICVASSSKYGDYFTGGRGAVMYVDDLELLYDY